MVLEATGTNTIPQSYWHDVSVYIPFLQRLFVKKNELFDDLARHKTNRIYEDNLFALRRRAVMLFRPLLASDRHVAKILEGAQLTYSMWEGYLKQDSTRRVRDWLLEHNIPLSTIHTSGHASVADLRQFAAALAPRRLVPIHSFETKRFGEFFDNVEQKRDGEWWGA